MLEKIDIPERAVSEICRRLGVQELWVFGSVLREDFSSGSDVDFLVVFEDNDAGPWLQKFSELEEALADILGRKVDVADKHAVEESRNYIRREHILNTARIVYVA